MKKIISVELTQDGDKVNLTWNAPEAATANLELLIATLAEMRSQTAPEVDWKAPTATTQLSLIQNPEWSIQTGVFGTAVCIRHPGFGWLSFQIPAEDLSRMALLVSHHHQPPKLQ